MFTPPDDDSFGVLSSDSSSVSRASEISPGPKCSLHLRPSALRKYRRAQKCSRRHSVDSTARQNLDAGRSGTSTAVEEEGGSRMA